MNKLYDANIKWIEDIIEIVLDSVSCDHQLDSDGAGKTYDDVSFSLDDEEDVLKKCVEAIPEVKLRLEVDGKFIKEKSRRLSGMSLYSCKGVSLRGSISVEEARIFIRSFIKELEEKIKCL